jgi:ubiquinone/menaquinone biosynthesis C-methylase UbiE
MHLNSELLFRKYAPPYFKKGMRILEIGPAGIPSAYSKIINDDSIQWDTIDFVDTKYIHSANKHLTYHMIDPYNFPLKDAQYDIVLSGQVIEHVQKVWIWVNELKRVTKKGGLIIIINPVSWPYHEAPLDCWRIYPDGIRALADEFHMEEVLCLYESLEKEEIQQMDKQANVIPGRSPDSIQSLKKKINWNRFIRNIPGLKRLQLPIEVSFDTISVLKKV